MTDADYKNGFFEDKKVVIKAIVLTVITIVAFWLDLKKGASFKPFSAWYLICGAGLFLFIICVEKYCKNDVGKKPYIACIAALFALFLLIGECFESEQYLDPILHGIRNGRFEKSAFCFFGYSILMYYVTVFIFAKAGSFFTFLMKSTCSPFWIYGKWLKEKPFLTVLITLACAYIPYTLASYPAIFLSDEVAQIYQGHKELGVIEPWYLQDYLIDENVYYNNHHPIVHTLILNFFLDIGINTFHSANVGIFLYTLTQMAGVIVTVALICRYLVKRLKASALVIFLLVLYYALSPRISNYMMVTTKDVYYSICLLWFITLLYALCTGKKSKWEYIGFGLSSLGIFLFRNEGRYILILAFIMLVIVAWKQGKWIGFIGMGSVIAFSLIFTNVILPGCHVTPGSRRETLSIPLQQTARYIKEVKIENLTEEEKDGISKVLPVYEIADVYDPYRSDKVKGRYYEDATDEDVDAYFKVWRSMFKKHTEIYLEATIDNYFQYIYPGETKMNQRGYEYSQSEFDRINEDIDKLGVKFEYPEIFNDYRKGYEEFREFVANIPILSLSITAATYSWWILYLLFYAIYKKRGLAIALLGSSLGVFLISFMGPCNGFFCRYTYPLIVVLPILTIFVMNLTDKKRKNNYVKKS